MVGLKIASEKIQEIVKILGLTEEQGKTYLALLSLGTATLGQISLLSGLDYIQAQDALQVLVGSNLVRRLSGKVGRYVALDPFLKSFLLAYDPITLVNIRKESSNVFQNRLDKITDILTGDEKVFKNNTEALEADFSQSLVPVKENFLELSNEIRAKIKSSEENIQENINRIQTYVNFLAKQSDMLNEEIRNVNLGKIAEIPGIFQQQILKTKEELSQISQNFYSSLEQYRDEFHSEVNSLTQNTLTEVSKESEKINSFLNKFESDRTRQKEDFENKIDNIRTTIDNLRTNAVQKQSNFKNIRGGYKEVDEGVNYLLKEIKAISSNMEPFISTSIEDIQSRKLFKGKDEFISGLSNLEENRRAIIRLLDEQSLISDKIHKLNSIFNETEEEIVETTEIGLKHVEEVVNEEIRLIADDIEDIKTSISSNERSAIETHLSTTKQSLQTNVNKLETIFLEKINEFINQLELNRNDFLDRLTIVVQQITTSFNASLETHFRETTTDEKETINIEEIVEKSKRLATFTTQNFQALLEQVLDIEESYNAYLGGLKAFTTSFADTQLESFISSLNKSKEIINSQIIELDKQLEQEISAIVFTIKQMKQKLNTISEISRLAELPDIDPSLLSSDLVIGESVIIMLLRDLTLRAKASLTILMPRPELQTMITASKLPMRTRINIIGDFKKVPKSTLKKVLSGQNVRLKQLSPIDFWACIRDSEELLVCPEPKDPTKEELIGVITSNENLVELFSQELMTYTTRSREILPQDLE